MLSIDIIDYIVLRNFGADHEGLGQDGGPIELEFDYLGHQGKGSLKASPSMQTNSNFNDAHVPRKLT
jgi:hypothetical protein